MKKLLIAIVFFVVPFSAQADIWKGTILAKPVGAGPDGDYTEMYQYHATEGLCEMAIIDELNGDRYTIKEFRCEVVK